MFAQAEGPCRSMTETIATKTGQYVRKINNSKKEVVPNYLGYSDTFIFVGGDDSVEHKNTYTYETKIRGKKYEYTIDIVFTTPLDIQETEFCQFKNFTVTRADEKAPTFSHPSKGKKECLPKLKEYIQSLESVLFPEVADEDRQRTADVNGKYIKTLSSDQKRYREFKITVSAQELGRRNGGDVTNYKVLTRNTGCYLRSIEADYTSTK